MTRPIQVGDFVVVVKPTKCSCPQNGLGRIFKVSAINPGSSDWWFCPTCGGKFKKLVGEGPSAVDEDGKQRGLHRLKRIPPLEELEGQRTQEDMKEPA